jgi:hypothetical protein
LPQRQQATPFGSYTSSKYLQGRSMQHAELCAGLVLVTRCTEAVLQLLVHSMLPDHQSISVCSAGDAAALRNAVHAFDTRRGHMEQHARLASWAGIQGDKTS